MSANTDTHADLVGVKEAAQYLGVCTRTIRRWIDQGRLTAYRMGPRLIRIDRAELDATLAPVPAAEPAPALGQWVDAADWDDAISVDLASGVDL